MDVCLILSQRIERNKPRRDSRQRGLGRTSSAISKTIEFLAISKPQARLFIHPYIHPSPRSHHPPRSSPEFVRPPDRPSVRCATFLSFTKIPHTLGLAAPGIPAPGSLSRLGGGVGGVAIPNEYTIVDDMLLGARAATRPAGARGTDRTVLVNTPDTATTRLI